MSDLATGVGDPPALGYADLQSTPPPVVQALRMWSSAAGVFDFPDRHLVAAMTLMCDDAIHYCDAAAEAGRLRGSRSRPAYSSDAGWKALYVAASECFGLLHACVVKVVKVYGSEHHSWPTVFADVVPCCIDALGHWTFLDTADEEAKHKSAAMLEQMLTVVSVLCKSYSRSSLLELNRVSNAQTEDSLKSPQRAIFSLSPRVCSWAASLSLPREIDAPLPNVAPSSAPDRSAVVDCLIRCRRRALAAIEAIIFATFNADELRVIVDDVSHTICMLLIVKPQNLPPHRTAANQSEAEADLIVETPLASFRLTDVEALELYFRCAHFALAAFLRADGPKAACDFADSLYAKMEANKVSHTLRRALQPVCDRRATSECMLSATEDEELVRRRLLQAFHHWAAMMCQEAAAINHDSPHRDAILSRLRAALYVVGSGVTVDKLLKSVPLRENELHDGALLNQSNRPTLFALSLAVAAQCLHRAFPETFCCLCVTLCHTIRSYPSADFDDNTIWPRAANTVREVLQLFVGMSVVLKYAQPDDCPDGLLKHVSRASLAIGRMREWTEAIRHANEPTSDDVVSDAAAVELLRWIGMLPVDATPREVSRMVPISAADDVESDIAWVTTGADDAAVTGGSGIDAVHGEVATPVDRKHGAVMLRLALATLQSLLLQHPERAARGRLMIAAECLFIPSVAKAMVTEFMPVLRHELTDIRRKKRESRQDLNEAMLSHIVCFYRVLIVMARSSVLCDEILRGEILECLRLELIVHNCPRETATHRDYPIDNYRKEIRWLLHHASGITCNAIACRAFAPPLLMPLASRLAFDSCTTPFMHTPESLPTAVQIVADHIDLAGRMLRRAEQGLLEEVQNARESDGATVPHQAMTVQNMIATLVAAVNALNVVSALGAEKTNISGREDLKAKVWECADVACRSISRVTQRWPSCEYPPECVAETAERQRQYLQAFFHTPLHVRHALCMSAATPFGLYAVHMDAVILLVALMKAIDKSGAVYHDTFLRGPFASAPLYASVVATSLIGWSRDLLRSTLNTPYEVGDRNTTLVGSRETSFNDKCGALLKEESGALSRLVRAPRNHEFSLSFIPDGDLDVGDTVRRSEAAFGGRTWPGILDSDPDRHVFRSVRFLEPLRCLLRVATLSVEAQSLPTIAKTFSIFCDVVALTLASVSPLARPSAALAVAHRTPLVSYAVRAACHASSVGLRHAPNSIDSPVFLVARLLLVFQRYTVASSDLRRIFQHLVVGYRPQTTSPAMSVPAVTRSIDDHETLLISSALSSALAWSLPFATPTTWWRCPGAFRLILQMVPPPENRTPTSRGAGWSLCVWFMMDQPAEPSPHATLPIASIEFGGGDTAHVVASTVTAAASIGEAVTHQSTPLGKRKPGRTHCFALSNLRVGRWYMFVCSTSTVSNQTTALLLWCSESLSSSTYNSGARTLFDASAANEEAAADADEPNPFTSTRWKRDGSHVDLGTAMPDVGSIRAVCIPGVGVAPLAAVGSRSGGVSSELYASGLYFGAIVMLREPIDLVKAQVLFCNGSDAVAGKRFLDPTSEPYFIHALKNVEITQAHVQDDAVIALVAPPISSPIAARCNDPNVESSPVELLLWARLNVSPPTADGNVSAHTSNNLAHTSSLRTMREDPAANRSDVLVRSGPTMLETAHVALRLTAATLADVRVPIAPATGDGTSVTADGRMGATAALEALGGAETLISLAALAVRCGRQAGSRRSASHALLRLALESCIFLTTSDDIPSYGSDLPSQMPAPDAAPPSFRDQEDGATPVGCVIRLLMANVQRGRIPASAALVQDLVHLASVIYAPQPVFDALILFDVWWRSPIATTELMGLIQQKLSTERTERQALRHRQREERLGASPHPHHHRISQNATPTRFTKYFSNYYATLLPHNTIAIVFRNDSSKAALNHLLSTVERLVPALRQLDGAEAGAETQLPSHLEATVNTLVDSEDEDRPSKNCMDKVLICVQRLAERTCQNRGAHESATAVKPNPIIFRYIEGLLRVLDGASKRLLKYCRRERQNKESTFQSHVSSMLKLDPPAQILKQFWEFAWYGHFATLKENSFAKVNAVLRPSWATRLRHRGSLPAAQPATAAEATEQVAPFPASNVPPSCVHDFEIDVALRVMREAAALKPDSSVPKSAPACGIALAAQLLIAASPPGQRKIFEDFRNHPWTLLQYQQWTECSYRAVDLLLPSGTASEDTDVVSGSALEALTYLLAIHVTSLAHLALSTGVSTLPKGVERLDDQQFLTLLIGSLQRAVLTVHSAKFVIIVTSFMCHVLTLIDFCTKSDDSATFANATPLLVSLRTLWDRCADRAPPEWIDPFGSRPYWTLPREALPAEIAFAEALEVAPLLDGQSNILIFGDKRREGGNDAEFTRLFQLAQQQENGQRFLAASELKRDNFVHFPTYFLEIIARFVRRVESTIVSARAAASAQSPTGPRGAGNNVKQPGGAMRMQSGRLPEDSRVPWWIFYVESVKLFLSEPRDTCRIHWFTRMVCVAHCCYSGCGSPHDRLEILWRNTRQGRRTLRWGVERANDHERECSANPNYRRPKRCFLFNRPTEDGEESDNEARMLFEPRFVAALVCILRSAATLLSVYTDDLPTLLRFDRNFALINLAEQATVRTLTAVSDVRTTDAAIQELLVSAKGLDAVIHDGKALRDKVLSPLKMFTKTVPIDAPAAVGAAAQPPPPLPIPAREASPRDRPVNAHHDPATQRAATVAMVLFQVASRRLSLDRYWHEVAALFTQEADRARDGICPCAELQRQLELDPQIGPTWTVAKQRVTVRPPSPRRSAEGGQPDSDVPSDDWLDFRRHAAAGPSGRWNHSVECDGGGTTQAFVWLPLLAGSGRLCGPFQALCDRHNEFLSVHFTDDKSHVDTVWAVPWEEMTMMRRVRVNVSTQVTPTERSGGSASSSEPLSGFEVHCEGCDPFVIQPLQSGHEYALQDFSVSKRATDDARRSYETIQTCDVNELQQCSRWSTWRPVRDLAECVALRGGSRYTIANPSSHGVGSAPPLYVAVPADASVAPSPFQLTRAVAPGESEEHPNRIPIDAFTSSAVAATVADAALPTSAREARNRVEAAFRGHATLEALNLWIENVAGCALPSGPTSWAAADDARLVFREVDDAESECRGLMPTPMGGDPVRHRHVIETPVDPAIVHFWSNTSFKPNVQIAVYVSSFHRSTVNITSEDITKAKPQKPHDDLTVAEKHQLTFRLPVFAQTVTCVHTSAYRSILIGLSSGVIRVLFVASDEARTKGLATAEIATEALTELKEAKCLRQATSLYFHEAPVVLIDTLDAWRHVASVDSEGRLALWDSGRLLLRFAVAIKDAIREKFVVDDARRAAWRSLPDDAIHVRPTVLTTSAVTCAVFVAFQFRVERSALRESTTPTPTGIGWPAKERHGSAVFSADGTLMGAQFQLTITAACSLGSRWIVAADTDTGRVPRVWAMSSALSERVELATLNDIGFAVQVSSIVADPVGGSDKVRDPPQILLTGVQKGRLQHERPYVYTAKMIIPTT